MSDRSNDLLHIRPDIKSTQIHPNMSLGERFQNETLRPILKFQNSLLLALFKNYIRKHKNTFYELSLEKRLQYIENAIQKDVKFRNSLKGLIIGLFTVDEYNTYIQDSSALNKRMMNMVVERLKDQVQLLDDPVLSY
ncbi:glyoxalase [Croceitalea marina]|uniref:Glyoxalase n=1 Tax=Croceitalea marina TaxID=1775166 RepID=A0ABW5MQY8_9FLAO